MSERGDGSSSARLLGAPRSFAILFSVWFSHLAYGAVIIVNAPTGAIAGGDGVCSISEAIQSANTNSAVNECTSGGVDTDLLIIENDITLLAAVDFTDGANGTPTISSAIAIAGQGHLILRNEALGCVINNVTGAGEFRLFNVAAGGFLRLIDVRLENGCADGASSARSGGAIFNQGTIALIENATFSGNRAFFGGAIKNTGNISQIRLSAMFNNQASNSGGALDNTGSVTGISNSTFSGNSATFGGAVFVFNATIGSIRHATFHGNSASNSGGALYFNDMTSGSVHITESLFSNSQGDDDCFFPVLADITGSDNLGDGSCPGTLAAATNIGPTLQDNGCAKAFSDGSCSPTHAVLAGSNAINLAPEAYIFLSDQRGFARLGRGDIGAFEFHNLSACDVALQTDGFTAVVGENKELAQAILCANLNGNALDTIELSQDVNVDRLADLSDGRNGTPVINSPIRLIGNGFALLGPLDACAIDSFPGNSEHRLLHVGETGVLSIRDIALRRGCADYAGVDFGLDRVGGAILNKGTIPVIESAILSNHFAVHGGGAIFNGPMGNIGVIRDSILLRNESLFGGAVSNDTNAAIGLIANVHFESNTAIGSALWSPGAVDTIRNSSFVTNSGNTVFVRGSIETLENSTFYDNAAEAVVVDGSVGEFRHNTVSSTNASFSAVSVFNGGSLAIENSIITGTSPGIDCGNDGSTLLGTNNLSDGTCPGSIGDVTNFSNEAFDHGCVVPLPDGSCIATQSPGPGDASLNASQNSPSITDARGFPRIGVRDIGAFEYRHPTVCPPALQSDGFTTNVADAAELREAIICSNLAGPSLETVNLSADVTLSEAVDGGDGLSGLPRILGNIIIDGQGHVLERDGVLDCFLDGVVDEKEFRLFHISSSGGLILRNIILQNGCADGDGTLVRSGGAILNSGSLGLLQKSTLTNNAATFGGGLANHNTVNAIDSTTFVANNATFGGGIYNGANNDTIGLIRNSTFSANLAEFGGGVYNSDDIVELRSSTFSGNSANSSGGGIHNSAGGTMNLRNSIVANTVSGGDCVNNGGSFAGSTNLTNGSCPGTVGAVTGFDSVLKDNGCTVPYASGACIETHALFDGSNAIDASVASGEGNDQRGFLAVGIRDIGAFEFFILDLIFEDGFELFIPPELELP